MSKMDYFCHFWVYFGGELPLCTSCRERLYEKSPLAPKAGSKSVRNEAKRPYFEGSHVQKPL
jgi:hypothetical protein